MTRAEWEALIARIEAAEGPDRELDADIHLALHPEHLVAPWMRGTPAWQSHIFFHATKQWTIEARRYTASLDAALSLVPEGWDYCLCKGWGEPAVVSIAPSGDVFEITVQSATPALALTVAAMRAQMAMRVEGDG